MRHPHVLQLIMDSLRYWVTEMHVDGFRFDLAATLARQFHEVDKLSAFFDLIQQDPVISPGQAHRRAVGRRRRRLPGRQLPAAVDGVERQVPRHRARLLARRAAHPRRVRVAVHRLQRPLRAQRPQADRVDQLRHRPRRLHAARPRVLQREAQRGQRRGRPDGESHNRSWNCGVEGPTDDPEVSALRLRQQRNFLTTLLLCQGVPMIAARRRDRAHPAGQQQRLLPGQRARLGRLGPRRRREASCSAFTRRLVHAAPRPRRLPPAPLLRRAAPTTAASPSWATSPGSSPRASPWTSRAWCDGEARTVMVFLNGQAIPAPDRRADASSTTTSSSSSTPTTRTTLHACPRRSGARTGRRDRHRPSVVDGRRRPARVPPTAS